MKRYQEALLDLDRAVALMPGSSEAYVARGAFWADTRDFKRAFADLDKAIDIDPSGPNAYVCRGVIWSAQGYLDRAIDSFSKAIELDRTYERASLRPARKRTG